MRYGSATLLDVLKASFDFQWVADVFLDGQRLIQNVPITNVVFNDDASSLVQGTGSCTIVYSGDFADSISPTRIGDALSPFGSQLVVYALVNAGPGFQERVTFGRYLISELPSITRNPFKLNGFVLNKGDVIDLNLKDLFFGVQRDTFDTPGSPPSLTSVWAEVQRLTQLPVTRSITDGAISTTVAYQQDKLQAVYDLALVLDATACMTADGTVSMRPNVWPAPVDTLSWGDGGTLLHVGRAMANDLVYNKVVIRTNASNGTAVLATAEIQSGPLRTSNADGSLSPYRRVPYYYSSDYITTQSQAAAYAQVLLPRVSTLRGVTVDLTESFNPLRDLGDVITVVRENESFTGRVTKIARSGKTQVTTVAVST